MKPLVDASVLAELAKAQPSEKALNWAASVTKIVLCALTLEELQRAVARSAVPGHEKETNEWVTHFIESHCEVLPVTGDMAREAGRLRVRQAELGKHLSQGEALLAVCAMTHSLPLVTSRPGVFSECPIHAHNPL